MAPRPQPSNTRRATALRLESPILTALFVVFLALPLLDLGLTLDPTPVPLQESSELLPAAPADLASLRSWPRSFEDYYRDHFGWRSWLIRRFHQLNFLLFRVSETQQVVVGREGWLFYGESAAVYARHDRPFTPTDRRRWVRSLANRQRWLEDRGIHYLFFVAPNKHSVYPERLPKSLASVGLPSRYEELTDLLRDRTEATHLDLHGPLREAKKADQVYERLGTHWNSRGAYVVYGKIFETLAGWFPRLRPVPWEQLTMADHGPGDLARMLALEDILGERRPKPVGGVRYPRLQTRVGGLAVTEQDDPSLPRAVIFHDSFAVSLAPYLAEHFSHATWVWRARFDGPLVLEVRPDVVIEERVERHLMRAPVRNVFPEEPVGSDSSASSASTRD